MDESLASLGGRDGAWKQLCDVMFVKNPDSFQEAADHHASDTDGETIQLIGRMPDVEGAPMECVTQPLHKHIINQLRERGDGRGRLPDMRWEFALSAVFAARTVSKQGDTPETTDGVMHLITVGLYQLNAVDPS